jgi:DNA modification methylase
MAPSQAGAGGAGCGGGVMHLLIRGNSLRTPLADRSVHCCVTSPPYWGLRDYNVPGQLGLEPTPDLYVARMVEVFREVRRILRDEGTCWVNMGDSYANAAKEYGRNDSRSDGGISDMHINNSVKRSDRKRNASTPGLKSKDLVGIPWRLAFALQADGWYLRSDIIWAKPNPMPESVTDRPTKSHEYLFLLAKQERYYFDQEAVRTESDRGGEKCGTGPNSLSRRSANGMGVKASGNAVEGGFVISPPTANLRSVWTIATEAYPGAHFATFPRRLVEPCIKAGTSEKGACPVCGAQWEREVDILPMEINRSTRTHSMGQTRSSGTMTKPRESSTLAWHPTCSHNAAPVPCTVFDPFIGSGTTIVVANALGRRGIGLDLSREYLGLAQQRIIRPHAAVPRPGREEHHPIFDAMEEA